MSRPSAAPNMHAITSIYVNLGAKAQCIVAPLNASLGGPDEGCHVKPRQRDRGHLVRPLASESAR